MTTPELTQWLRDNSSGVYRPAAEAADVIEQLQRERKEAREELATMTAQRDRLAEALAEERMDRFWQTKHSNP